MPFFLAIDAGGTSTRALLADDTSILARASTGSVKLMRVSQVEATLRLTNLLVDLAVAARVPLNRITRTCIGLAGLSIPAVRAWATDTLATTVSGSLILLGDEEIALDAAFPNASGVLLIAGTGSNCIGRAPDGTLHRAGGYGPILGDSGGGFWIGLEALRAALHALDTPELDAPETGTPETGESLRANPDTPGAPSIAVSPRWVGSTNLHAPATKLLNEIQHHFNLTTLPQLIELGNRRTDPAPDFASLAPIVARAAAAGNPIASAILRQAGGELATLIAHVAVKMDTPEIPVAFTGSILTEIPAVHASLARLLARTLPAAHLHPTPVDPLTGALFRARHG